MTAEDVLDMASYDVTGTCIYCGQSAILKSNEPIDGKDADMYITAHCRCDDAVRARCNEEVDELVDKLFGDACAEDGLVPERGDTVQLLAHAVVNGCFTSATVKTPKGATCKITFGRAGFVVKRTDKRDCTECVGVVIGRG